MGTDVWTEEGILIPIDSFLSIITKTKTKKIISNINEVLKQKRWEEDKNTIGEVLNIKSFDKELSKDELIESLGKIVRDQVKGETGKYGDSWIDNSEELSDVLSAVVNTMAKDPSCVPDVSEVKAFGSYRYSGLYEVQLGEPYVCFSPSECFEQVMTDTGKALAKALKTRELDVSSWSVVSY